MNFAGNSIDKTTAHPVDGQERIVALDVIRGFAVLGILVMNIQSFSMIEAAYLNPGAVGQLNGANYLVWLTGQLFFSVKFITLFSILFGAGIYLMAERRSEQGLKSAGLHYRRMLGLFAIGLVHGYVFWIGDVLMMYAICGAVVYPLWRLSQVWRLSIAALLFLIGSLLMLVSGWSMPYWPTEELERMRLESWQPTAEMIQHEIATYTGPWLPQLRDRISSALSLQLTAFPFYLFWHLTSLMLIGMSLMKARVLTGKASRRTYWGMSLAGFVVGLPLIAWGVFLNIRADWQMEFAFFFGIQPNHYGSLILALGYVGTLCLILPTRIGTKVGKCLAPVGRMALTNYLMQTLICTTLFYGHGFGWFMSVERIGQVLIVFMIWCFQVLFSHVWLSRNRFGPMEYLWRWASYGKRPTPGAVALS